MRIKSVFLAILYAFYSVVYTLKGVNYTFA